MYGQIGGGTAAGVGVLATTGASVAWLIIAAVVLISAGFMLANILPRFWRK